MEGKRRYWPMALAVSMALHAALLAGISLLGERVALRARPVPPAEAVLSLIANDGEEAETFSGPFLEPTPTPKQTLPAGVAASAESIETLPALLVNPLAEGSAPAQGVDAAGAGHAPTGAGPGSTTSFFQVAARGARIVYVIDVSASMGKDGRLRTARQELEQSLQKLPATARFQVIVYNSQPQFLLPRLPGWLEPSAERLGEISQALERQAAEGSTEHGPALQKALALQPDVVFFLTDADDLKQDHLRLANLLNRGRAAIHTIELTVANRDRQGMPLQILARDNRGSYQAVDLSPVVP